MDRVLCGIETEYGLWIDQRGPENQVEDSQEFIESYPSPCYVGWDYRFESPRSDLRGFSVKHLAVDPEDMKFEQGKVMPPAHVVRADRVLPNGARLYNDHGHPEFSTSECWTPQEAAWRDREGEFAILECLQSYQEKSGREARAYKNNTDFHKASYGTHESYLVPREIGFEELYRAVTPMLVVRQLLTGAGKVGAEHGEACAFQMSQRADFFAEPANLETLYRRPVFNSRDEPHADPTQWLRLHVIPGDANRMVSNTERKMLFVTLAIRLAMVDRCPLWSFKDPVRAIEQVSKGRTMNVPIELTGGGNATAAEVLESYFSAAEELLALSERDREQLAACRALVEFVRADDWHALIPHVDWAAKRSIVEMVQEEDGLADADPALQSIDLEYANIDPEASLFQALIEMGTIIEEPAPEHLPLTTRALARGHAVHTFAGELEGVCWRALTFKTAEGPVTVDLPPNLEYPEELVSLQSVKEFIAFLEALKSR